MIELKITLQTKQRQFMEAIEKYPITGFGGARGGGKSFALRNIFLLRRFKYPGSAGALFRQTYPELEANHIRPLLTEHPYLRPYWNESKKLLSLPNGSTLQFSHCRSDADVALYQGREIQDLGIDECGQWSEGMFRTLLGSNRSSRVGIPARCAITMNPGGFGHAWIKRIFINREFNERERPEDYHFIQSLVSDNLALQAADPDYVHRLNAEPNEMLRRAYMFGDWDITAGSFFTDLRREIHFIAPFDIPKHWKRFGAYDFGYNHPASFGWYCCDEDGNAYKYRELVRPKVRVDQFATLVKEFPDTERLEYIVAGHDCWSDRGVSTKSSAPTIAEEFANQGLFLSKANIGRIQGATQLRNYLAHDEANQPRLRIFNSCPVTFDCLTRMQHDPNRVEDVLKVDAEDGNPLTGDDAYDETRMAIMSRPPLTDRPKKRLLPGTEAWSRREVEEMEKAALGALEAEKNVELGLATPSDDPWAKNPTMFDNDW